MPRTVMVESPYAGDVKANEAYARRCMKDSLDRGEAPMLGHLLYTQVLDDKVPDERRKGIEADKAWLCVSSKVVLYVDRGVSSGMTEAVTLATELKIPIEHRRIDG